MSYNPRKCWFCGLAPKLPAGLRNQHHNRIARDRENVSNSNGTHPDDQIDRQAQGSWRNQLHPKAERGWADRLPTTRLQRKARRQRQGRAQGGQGRPEPHLRRFLKRSRRGPQPVDLRPVIGIPHVD